MEVCGKMLILSGVAVAAMFFFSPAHGAMMLSPGACPDGKQPGESWSSGDCGECTCLAPTDWMSEGGYSCASCGVYSIQLDNPQCYTTKETPDASYPQCCNIAVRCPGDDGYNETYANGSN
ncbi:uncharacterized protein [Littorina saxatilis]|uniref:Uncharacterized protein n=1 Tax=Littorina saxatilis TaxID=31220 RepID=A0AAN9G9P3_9CAEN